MARLDNKLEILKQEKEQVQLEISDNDQLGTQVGAAVRLLRTACELNIRTVTVERSLGS